MSNPFCGKAQAAEQVRQLRRAGEGEGEVDRAAQVYAFVVAYKRRWDGNSPTLREIAAGLGSISLSSVHRHLERLIAEGRLFHVGSAAKGYRCRYGVTGGVWSLPGLESHAGAGGPTTARGREGEAQ